MFQEITGRETVKGGEAACEVGGVIESKCACRSFYGVANFGEKELLGAGHAHLVDIFRQGEAEGGFETVAEAREGEVSVRRQRFGGRRVGKIPKEMGAHRLGERVPFCGMRMCAESTLAPKQDGFECIHREGVAVRRVLCGMAHRGQRLSPHATFGGRKRGSQI